MTTWIALFFHSSRLMSCVDWSMRPSRSDSSTHSTEISKCRTPHCSNRKEKLLFPLDLCESLGYTRVCSLRILTSSWTCWLKRGSRGFVTIYYRLLRAGSRCALGTRTLSDDRCTTCRLTKSLRCTRTPIVLPSQRERGTQAPLRTTLSKQSLHVDSSESPGVCTKSSLH